MLRHAAYAIGFGLSAVLTLVDPQASTQAGELPPDDADGPKLYFSGCGELSIGPQGCTLLIADNGLVLAPDNLVGLVPGEHVFMQGMIDNGVSPCFPADIPGLTVEIATYCLERCGELILVADDCVFLLADDGLPIFLGDAFGFEIGSRVHAAGGQNFDFFCTGLDTYVGLVDPVVTSAGSDLTCDEAVGPADLAQLLATWGPCAARGLFSPCPADFDDDGEVGPADLATLLADWD